MCNGKQFTSYNKSHCTTLGKQFHRTPFILQLMVPVSSHVSRTVANEVDLVMYTARQNRSRSFCRLSNIVPLFLTTYLMLLLGAATDACAWSVENWWMQSERKINLRSMLAGSGGSVKCATQQEQATTTTKKLLPKSELQHVTPRRAMVGS